jgi:hypothetical protein
MSSSAILARLKAKQGNEASVGSEFSAWIREDPIQSGSGWHWSAQEIRAVFDCFKNDASRSSRWDEFVEYAAKKGVRFTCEDAKAVMLLTSNVSSRVSLLKKVAPWIGDGATHKAALIDACFKENRASAMSAESIEFGGGRASNGDGGDDDDNDGDMAFGHGHGGHGHGGRHGGPSGAPHGHGHGHGHDQAPPMGFGGPMGGPPQGQGGMGPMGGFPGGFSGGFPGMAVGLNAASYFTAYSSRECAFIFHFELCVHFVYVC